MRGLPPEESRRVGRIINSRVLDGMRREFYKVVREIDSLDEAPEWVMEKILEAEQDYLKHST